VTATTGQVYYADADDDGYGSMTVSINSCADPGEGYVTDHTDCNDNAASVHPDAVDICNDADDNCDGVTDEHSFTSSITPTGILSVCKGQPVPLSSNTLVGVSYQWQKNAVDIDGATDANYTATTKGKYRVKETNSYNCEATSAATQIKTLKQPKAIITPLGNLDICVSGSVVLKANGGVGFTYQWKKGSEVLVGATAQTYTATKKGFYVVIVTNTNSCSKTSESVQVTKACKLGGEKSASDGALTLYPNPTSGRFVIELNSGDETATEAIIQVVNLMGQHVYEATVPAFEGKVQKELSLDASYASELYLVRVIMNDEVFTGRLVIQR
jgi:hypothetical protein